MESSQSSIAEAATAVLASSSIRELRHIRVDGRENKIQLSGQVRSFYHKQLAQESVRTVAGGVQVINRLDVSEADFTTDA